MFLEINSPATLLLARLVICRVASVTLRTLVGCLTLAAFSMPHVAAVDILATAQQGQPYGVASVEIPLARPVLGNPFPPLQVTEVQGRVLYPMAKDMQVAVDASDRDGDRGGPRRGRLIGRVGELIRQLASPDVRQQQTVARQVTFLFQGSQPLQIQLSDSGGDLGTYEIVPGSDPTARQQLLGQWWNAYAAAAKRQIDAADYPPWVETYLVAMLSSRIGFPLPAWYPTSSDGEDELIEPLKLVGGAVGVANQVFARKAAGTELADQRASEPLPAPPDWQAAPIRERLEDVAVEPIAKAVPPECFYIRYGSFENFLWFRDLSADFGGDVSRMITLRGFADDSAARIENQLSLQTSELSRMLGPTVIADQALIGHDMFMADGAAIGTLFRAKNTYLLRTSLNNDRSQRAGRDPALILSEVKLRGQTVSLLKSSDNRVRSYLAVAGEFILVANSQALVERFLEVAESGDSLAATSTFRLSRQFMPLDRNDTIFAYFSPEMLQGLASPEYLIELRRRLDARADIALVYLARVAAAAEGSPARSIDELRSAGFLPASFGRRSDGSGVITVGDRVLDSKRGARGSFLPIDDADLRLVTPDEADWYRRIAAAYDARVHQLDPIMVGIHRENIADQPGRERLSIHAEIAPFVPDKYGWIAEQLGPPTQVAMEFPPDDIVAVQAHVASATLGPPTHLFAAAKDTAPPDPAQFDGILQGYLALRQVPGYLGAWPLPGALDRLPLGIGRGQPVGPGMSRLIGGVYRYTGGGFSVLSFDHDLLLASLPHLAATEVDDSAQVRLHVGDVAGSQLQGWVNGQLYQRAAEASLAGANFLNMLTRQLGVESAAGLSTAEQVLGMSLQCSLGGEYQLDDASGRWMSTAWPGDRPSPTAPADYVAPIMTWFRSADATLTQYADRLVADAVVEITRARP